MNRFRIFVLLAMAAAFPARAVEEKSMPHAEADPLVVDAAMQEQLGIATAIVATQIQTAEIQAPGGVKANAYATVVVSPRVAAQVVRRQAKLGDAVTAGQPLVTLSSVEVAEAQGALIVAEREWQRVKTLGADAVSAKRYTEAQVARDQANAKLRAFGLGSAEVSALLRAGSSRANGDFVLLAPQAGRVATDDFVVGERVEPGKPLFTPWANMFCPRCSKPCGLAKVARRICPRSRVTPLENTPRMPPSSPMMKLLSVPAAEPSCRAAARLLLSEARPETCEKSSWNSSGSFEGS